MSAAAQRRINKLVSATVDQPAEQPTQVAVAAAASRPDQWTHNERMSAQQFQPNGLEGKNISTTRRNHAGATEKAFNTALLMTQRLPFLSYHSIRRCFQAPFKPREFSVDCCVRRKVRNGVGDAVSQTVERWARAPQQCCLDVRCAPLPFCSGCWPQDVAHWTTVPPVEGAARGGGASRRRRSHGTRV